MTDLSTVLPDFPVEAYTRLIPSLENNRITSIDLITLDASEIAKRARLPLPEVRKLCQDVLEALQSSCEQVVNESLEETSNDDNTHAMRWSTIGTLDEDIDAALGGGMPCGYVTEVTGESGVGKTQFLLSLLLACQLPAPHGVERSALYISTESALPTVRLAQMLKSHPILLASDPKPSLDRIVSIVTPDLETQDHILRFQVPVAVEKFNVGLIVIDSVAANYRAEFERPGANQNGANMAKRSGELVKLGALLRSLAQKYNLAVVVSNQVSDRFTFSPQYVPQRQLGSLSSAGNEFVSKHGQASAVDHTTCGDPQPSMKPIVLGSSSLSAAAELGLTHPSHRRQPPQAVPPQCLTANPMTLDHQQRWFTGWGDDHDQWSATDPGFQMLPQKTPSLGLVWTSQVAARIALIKTPVYGTGSLIGDDDDVARGEQILKKWHRHLKVVFASWAEPTGPGLERAVQFEIGKWGIKAVKDAQLGE